MIQILVHVVIDRTKSEYEIRKQEDQRQINN